MHMWLGPLFYAAPYSIRRATFQLLPDFSMVPLIPFSQAGTPASIPALHTSGLGFDHTSLAL